MNSAQLAQYRCPLCQHALTLNNKSFRCENNHSFDQAKQGYVNLLPVQFKHSKEPGDNKAMVQARRAFLDKGYYQPLVDAMLALNQQYGRENGSMFDAGCGEGFYTHQHKTQDNSVYGIDISKEAIKKAAKRYKECHFSVGTLSMLPFNDNSIDWVTCVYAPILEEEYTRVLAEDGYLLTVTPAKDHLLSLKQKIYIDAQQHDDEKQAISNLTLVHQQQLGYDMTITSGEDAIHLLAMTPLPSKPVKKLKPNCQRFRLFHAKQTL
mgnify:CR=1 FL=1